MGFTNSDFNMARGILLMRTENGPVNGMGLSKFLAFQLTEFN